MKKLISCITVYMVAILPAAAWNSPLMETTVLRAEAAQQQQPQLPSLDPVQKERFPVYLELAEIVMRQDQLYYLNPDFLGAALLNSVSSQMRFEKSPNGDVPLTEEEQRAVYYAIYSLLPKKNRSGMMSYKEYVNRYRVENWGYFSQASQKALNLIYQAVQDIATQQNNYRSTWLRLLTH